MSDLIAQYPQDTADTSPLRSMQEVAMSDSNASKMLSTYNVAYWGGNYYDVNELGHISVCPDPDVPQARVDLTALALQIQADRQQRLPALFCFQIGRAHV